MLLEEDSGRACVHAVGTQGHAVIAADHTLGECSMKGRVAENLDGTYVVPDGRMYDGNGQSDGEMR